MYDIDLKMEENRYNVTSNSGRVVVGCVPSRMHFKNKIWMHQETFFGFPPDLNRRPLGWQPLDYKSRLKVVLTCSTLASQYCWQLRRSCGKSTATHSLNPLWKFLDTFKLDLDSAFLQADNHSARIWWVSVYFTSSWLVLVSCV